MAAVVARGNGNFLGQDYNHAEDPTYKNFRQEAQKWHDKRTELSKRSQDAYNSGDKQAAHQLSEQLKEALHKAEECNKKAAQYVFVQNNADSEGNEIDLHGLYVNEAKWVLQKRIAEALRTGQLNLEVIVGKGNHSANGVAKLKPAIDELCSEAGLNHYIDQKNTGVMVIDFTKTPNIRLPDSWDTLPFDQQQYNAPPQQLYQQHQPQGYQQPQYQQQGFHSQYQQQGSTQQESIIDIFCRALAGCFK